MTALFTDTDKYEEQATPSPIIEAFHGAIKDLIRRRLAESGDDWNDFVFKSSYSLITAEDLATVEKRVLDSGYRYAGSAMISVLERPEAYKPMEGAEGPSAEFSFEHPEAIVESADESGRTRCGQGDNVVDFPGNVIGTARYYRSIQDVMKGLTDGVPDNTIGIIDDSGGTLTAPILEHFKAVICAGGTTRSHLGILTREYGIPCLMSAQISGIRDGDLIEIEVSAPAKTTEAYQQSIDMSVRVWKLAASARPD